MARRNLKYQFLQAINNSFKENMDKHSDKANGIRNTDKIYSYSARSNLIDLSANFANFMKESYPEIHNANKIGTERIQAFLNFKSSNCSQATLNQYSALFRKLEKCVNVKYHCNVAYQCDVVPVSSKNGGGKIRNVMLSQNDFKTLNEEIRMFAGHEDFSTTAKFYNYSTISWDKRTDAFERALG